MKLKNETIEIVVKMKLCYEADKPTARKRAICEAIKEVPFDSFTASSSGCFGVKRGTARLFSK